MTQTKEKKQSLRSQSTWLLVAKVVGFAFSFVLPLLIVRNLPQSEVGQYRESFQVIANAIVLLPLGFSMSAYYFLSRETERRGAAILNILLFNFVVGGIACLFFWAYPQALAALFRHDDMLQLSPLIGVVIWIWIFSTFLETVAIANQEAKVATVFIILAQMTKTLLMGAAVFSFASVESFLYAAMIQGILQSVILFFYLRSRFPGFLSSFDFAFFLEQARYAMPFGLAGILWMAQTDIHNYFVGYKFTSSEYAIYAYGCFEVPLIAMLSESVTSVLIPRMNELQQRGDRDEMIRLTTRATEKLSFFYFPIYVFLFITANTFIITLFTENYAASASVFIINITILPFSVIITDPILRSYKELGRVFLLTRLSVLMAMVAVLYFSLPYLSLTGIIAIAVGAIIIEKCIAEGMIIAKLGLSWRHITLLKNVGKTAIAALIAGVFTYFVYKGAHVYLQDVGQHFAEEAFHTKTLSILNFFGGSLVLGISALVFAPIYLASAYLMGLIDEDEKQVVRKIYYRLPFVRRPVVT